MLKELSEGPLHVILLHERFNPKTTLSIFRVPDENPHVGHSTPEEGLVGERVMGFETRKRQKTVPTNVQVRRRRRCVERQLSWVHQFDNSIAMLQRQKSKRRRNATVRMLVVLHWFGLWHNCIVEKRFGRIPIFFGNNNNSFF